MRSLIADLGDAYCLELRRTGIGPFDVAEADDERIVPLDDALGFLPAVTLGRRRAEGRPRRRRSLAPASPAGTVRPASTPTASSPSPSRARTATLKPVVGFRG